MEAPLSARGDPWAAWAARAYTRGRPARVPRPHITESNSQPTYASRLLQNASWAPETRCASTSNQEASHGFREPKIKQCIDTEAVKRQVPAQVVLRDAEHQPSNLERCGHAVRKNSS